MSDLLKEAIRAVRSKCTCYNPLSVQLFVQRLGDLDPNFFAGGNFALPAWEGRLLSLTSHLENRRTNKDINAVVNWWNDYQPAFLFSQYSRGLGPLPLSDCDFNAPIPHGRTGKEETYVWVRQILSHLSRECRTLEYKSQWLDVLRSHYNRTRQHDLDLINTLLIQMAEDGLLQFR